MKGMENFIGKVTSRGQITLPQQLREEKGITENDYVVMRKVGKYIVIGKVEARLDEITAAFEEEAKANKITKKKLLAELSQSK
ncbi:MAG: AbrB/MazE/SpoVT family DNA-binding domain-containing protein [Candidatus Micrarchaeota archaeon]